MLDKLFIIGASTRAAAFSALRANLRPWCADLFADADLALRCPVMRVSARDNPRRFLELAKYGPSGPWMFTGGLENRRRLVAAIGQLRPLWGNDEQSLRLARSPTHVDRVLSAAGIPHPAVCRHPGDVPRHRRFLVKPLRGTGGSGIHTWWSDEVYYSVPRGMYFQEFVEGDPCAAVFLGQGEEARLVGVTRQLVGVAWLHAGRFRYCGSVGPIFIDEGQQQALERLGSVLTRGCRLRGLFGVDGVLRQGVFWPVEINPRYTASAEVLEHAAAVPLLAWHRRVFDPAAPLPISPSRPRAIMGKAILFARDSLTFPADGPWAAVLSAPWSNTEQPPFADIPNPGERIEAGRPILTFFTRGENMAACEQTLQRTAADLDQRFFRQ